MIPPRTQPPRVTVAIDDASVADAFAGLGVQGAAIVAVDAAGTTILIELDGPPFRSVALRQDSNRVWFPDVVDGGVLPCGGAFTIAADGDQVAFTDVAGQRDYPVAARVQLPGQDCCAWFEDTLWRGGGDAPGLLRVASRNYSGDAVLAYYLPETAAPRWEVALNAGAGLVAAADAAISPDAAIAVVQFTDGKLRAELVAYEVSTGRVAWRTSTAPTRYDDGAVVFSRDGTRVGTVLRDTSRADCERCELLEERSVTDGALVRVTHLDDSYILGGRERWRELTLGLDGDEFWYQFWRPEQSADSAKAGAALFAAYDLRTGKGRAAGAGWRTQLEDRAAPLRLFPVRGGILGVRATGTTSVEVTSFDRAP